MTEKTIKIEVNKEDDPRNSKVKPKRKGFIGNKKKVFR